MDLFDIRHLNESLAQSMVDGLDDEISRNQFVLGDSVLSFGKEIRGVTTKPITVSALIVVSTP